MSSQPECDVCGNPISPENKNAAGHYREKCWACILEVAHISGDEPKRTEPP